MAVLEVVGLDRRFDGRVVLSGIDVQVAAGKAVAVVGPNGAGKSTLLQCVIGAQRPDAGTVVLNGVPLREQDPVIRAQLSVVDDSIEFLAGLSAAENLGLLAVAHDVPQADAAVAALLEEVGLTGQRHQFPASLSSGQRRRLALAAGFIRPWSLMVLDEPEQRLDADGIEWLTGRLLDAKAAGGAILFASHHAGLIDAVADLRLTIGPST